MTNQIPDPNQPQQGDHQSPPVPPATPVPPAAPQGAPQPPPSSHPQQGGAQYQAPPPPPPHGAPQGAPQDLSNTVVLNYWLSVFFAWLPALIFYFTEKGKSPLSDQYHRENLNFSLIRTGAMIIAMFVAWIPILGQIIWLVAWLGGLILHLLVAVKAKDRFLDGEAPGFLFNIPLVK